MNAAIAQPACVVNCAVYRDGRREDIPLDAISDVLAVEDGSFVWVGLYEPGEDLLDKLQEEFGLHDLAIEDAHNAHQRPKIEAFGNTLFVAVHTAQLVDDHVRFGHSQPCLTLDVGGHLRLVVEVDAPRIEQIELATIPIAPDSFAVPRHAGLGVDHGLAATGESISPGREPLPHLMRASSCAAASASAIGAFGMRSVSTLWSRLLMLTM